MSTYDDCVKKSLHENRHDYTDGFRADSKNMCKQNMYIYICNYTAGDKSIYFKITYIYIFIYLYISLLKTYIH